MNAPGRVYVRWGKSGDTRVSYMQEAFFGPIDAGADYVRADLVDGVENEWRKDLAAEQARAERAEALLAEAVEALQWIEDRRAEAVVRATAIIAAPEDEAVLALCRKHGFGAVMDSAARQWAAIDDTGAFFIGGCLGDTSARATLARIKEAKDNG